MAAATSYEAHFSVADFPVDPIYYADYDLLVARGTMTADLDVGVEIEKTPFAITYPKTLPGTTKRAVFMFLTNECLCTLGAAIWSQAAEMVLDGISHIRHRDPTDPILLPFQYCKNLILALCQLSLDYGNALIASPEVLTQGQVKIAEAIVVEWNKAAKTLQHTSNELKKKSADWLLALTTDLRTDISTYFDWTNVLGRGLHLRRGVLKDVVGIHGAKEFGPEDWDTLIGQPRVGVRREKEVAAKPSRQSSSGPS